MSENTTSFRMRIGRAEIEFEGRESFLKDGLLPVVEGMSEILERRGLTQSPDSEDEIEANASATEVNQAPQWSMTTLASRMSAKTGPELAMAACAYLTFFKGQETFSRSDILIAMKEAKNCYTKYMSGNLSGTLKRLLNRGEINEVTKDIYALSVKGKNEIKKQIDEYR